MGRSTEPEHPAVETQVRITMFGALLAWTSDLAQVLTEYDIYAEGLAMFKWGYTPTETTSAWYVIIGVDAAHGDEPRLRRLYERARFPVAYRLPEPRLHDLYFPAINIVRGRPALTGVLSN